MLNSQISNKINSSLSIGKQVASVSHSTLLSSHVEFVPSGNDHSMCVTNLKSKYHQFKGSNTNENKIVSDVHINGQMKYNNHKHVKASPQNGKEDSNKNYLADGIPVPRVQIFNPTKVQLEWKQIHKIGAGLINMGNTCFMNTVIQCLTYCTPLTNYLLYDEDHSYKCKLVGFCMICELQKHMKRALERHGQAIKPMYIYQKLKSIAKHFQFGRQEDAHEFLRYVIDNLWKASLANYDGGLKLDPTSKETTVVNQIFGGYNRSQVICLMCHGRSNTYDHFMDFILDIKNASSLEVALKKFIEPEMLEDENAYKCPKCGTKVKAEKKFTVHKPPNVATFQLKRFDYNRMFGGKITKPVSYPEKLDLRPFMSENKGSPVMYRLSSVLVHMGHTCNSGHYFCYVRNSNGLWYLMDDTRVHQVSQNQVLSQQAYVLFYIRVPSPPIKQVIKKPVSAPLPVNNKIVKNGPLSHNNTESTSSISRSPYVPSHHSCISSLTSPPLQQNGNKPGIISANNNKPGVSATNGNKPGIISTNGSSPRPSFTNHQANSVLAREKISFDIKRPSTGKNGLNLNENGHRLDLGVVVKRKEVTKPGPLLINASRANNSVSTKTLVPYDVKDSSSSSDDEKTVQTKTNSMVNGHSKKDNVPLQEIPLPGEQKVNLVNQESSLLSSSAAAALLPPESKAHFDLPIKPDRLSPRMNLPLLGGRSLPDCNIRAKATNSWHVMDDRLQSPSVASGSSNNSVTSTTDWNVTETDGVIATTPLPTVSVPNLQRNKERSYPGWSVKPKDREANALKERKPLLSNVSVDSSLCNGIDDLNEKKPKTDDLLHAPKGDGRVTSRETDQLSSDSPLGRGEPNRCERQFETVPDPAFRTMRDTGGPEAGTSGSSKHSGLAHRKRRNESVLSHEASDCPMLKKCKEGEQTGFTERSNVVSPLRIVKDNNLESGSVTFKKQKVKNRSERRRRRSGESDGSYECEWVEKTKETLDAEKVKDNGVPEKLLNPTTNVTTVDTPNPKSNWGSKKETDTVNELLNMAGKGYGNGVSTWDGESSSVNNNNNNFDGPAFYAKLNSDDYNEEFDMGKTKKIKMRYEETDNSTRNPFQQFQDTKRKKKNHYQDRNNWNRNPQNIQNYQNRGYQPKNNSHQRNNNGGGYTHQRGNRNNSYHQNNYQKHNDGRYNSQQQYQNTQNRFSR